MSTRKLSTRQWEALRRHQEFCLERHARLEGERIDREEQRLLGEFYDEVETFLAEQAR